MMRLSLVEPYITITSLNPIDLPDLTIVTGKNGTGKSQLLTAIENGNISIEGIDRDQIGIIRQKEFVIEDGGVHDNLSLLNALQSRYVFIRGLAADHKSNNSTFFLNTQEKQAVKAKAKAKQKPIYNLNYDDFDVDMVLANKFSSYKSFVDNQLQHTGNEAQRLFAKRLASSLGEFFEDITREQVKSILYADEYSGKILPQQLSLTILNYLKLWRANQSNRLFNENMNHSHLVLTDQEFEKKYGPKPWEMIEEMLSSIEGFKYKLDFDPTVFDPESHTLQLRLIGRKEGSATVDVASLSSGEKTLLALVASLYSAAADKDFPKLLLLDEIDATLHPSMSEVFLSLIKSHLIKKLELKVILVTHSPSVVAMSPDESIYTMKQEGSDRLIATPKAEALNQLTQGYASVTTDQLATTLQFRFSDSPKKLVFFEGPSDLIYMRYADDQLKTPLSREFDLTYAGSSSHLNNFWKLITSADQEHGYTHGMGASLIYDCDQKRDFDVHGKHCRWAIERVEENPIKDGIENLFTADFVERAKKANSDYFIENNGTIKVNGAYKVELANWFKSNAQPADIRPFKQVLQLVRKNAR